MAAARSAGSAYRSNCTPVAPAAVAIAPLGMLVSKRPGGARGSEADSASFAAAATAAASKPKCCEVANGDDEGVR